jgi:hypothetical protein
MSPSTRQNPISCLKAISDADAALAASPQTLADLAAAIVATPAPPERPRRRVTGHLAARRWLLPAPLLVATVAALVVALTAGAGGNSLVARAYAAISPNGAIVHYLESTTLSSRSPSGRVMVMRSTSEVWTSGSRTHALTTTDPLRSGEHRSSTLETATDGHQLLEFTSGTLVREPFSPSCRKALSLSPSPLSGCGDPVAILRASLRSGRLHATGQAMFDGRRVDVIAGRERLTGILLRVRVLIDPRTFVPLEVQSISGATITTTVSHYQRLALTDQNAELLAMRPHPHARIVTVRVLPTS